jgi:hypothetical protein
MATPPQLQIVHAYRNLYRAALRAVHYTAPSRITVRDHLRVAFRRGDPINFDQGKVDNTLMFLESATRERGMEHRILKNITHVWWERARRDATLRCLCSCCFVIVRVEKSWLTDMLNPSRNRQWRGDEDRRLYRAAYAHFDATVKMLNDSLGLCI